MSLLPTWQFFKVYDLQNKSLFNAVFMLDKDAVYFLNWDPSISGCTYTECDYAQNWAELLKIEEGYTRSKLLKDLDIALDYYKKKDNV